MAEALSLSALFAVGSESRRGLTLPMLSWLVHWAVIFACCIINGPMFLYCRWLRASRGNSGPWWLNFPALWMVSSFVLVTGKKDREVIGLCVCVCRLLNSRLDFFPLKLTNSNLKSIHAENTFVVYSWALYVSFVRMLPGKAGLCDACSAVSFGFCAFLYLVRPPKRIMAWHIQWEGKSARRWNNLKVFLIA